MGPCALGAQPLVAVSSTEGCGGDHRAPRGTGVGRPPSAVQRPPAQAGSPSFKTTRVGRPPAWGRAHTDQGCRTRTRCKGDPWRLSTLGAPTGRHLLLRNLVLVATGGGDPHRSGSVSFLSPNPGPRGAGRPLRRPESGPWAPLPSRAQQSRLGSVLTFTSSRSLLTGEASAWRGGRWDQKDGGRGGRP